MNTTKPTVQELQDNPALIEVGMGATYRTALGGIYIAYTVIAVRRGGKELDVQRDTVTIVGENTMADDADRTYEPNPNGKIETITKRKNGSYILKGQPMERWASTYTVGVRRDWTDYSQ
jgi:hypothetical protein